MKRLPWFVFLISVTLFLPAFAASPVISAIEILMTDEGPAKWNFQITADQVREVLPIHEGDSYSPEAVEKAVSYLRKWGQFEEVAAESSVQGGKATVRFKLKQGFVVSGIDIYGGYPFLSTRLRRATTIHPGDLYNSQSAQDQIQKLKSFYERQGYANTEVTFKPELNPTKKTINLVYRIRKGRRYRIRDVEVQGATVFPHSYFISQINPLILYNPTRLRRRLEKIRQDYQNKGYLRARVRLKELRKDDEQRTMTPALEVVEGRYVKVLFQDNDRVSLKTFKTVVPLYTEGGYSQYDIDASVEAIKNYYRKIGYQEVQVRVQQSDMEKQGLHITFLIDEGPQTRVKKITIDNNHFIDDGTIKKDLVTKENAIFEKGYYWPPTVDHDFRELPRILQSRGALDGKSIDYDTKLNPFHDKAHVRFTVDEGEMTSIRQIRFEGNHGLSANRLKKHIKSQERHRLNPFQLNNDTETLTFFYSNQGYPYAKITSETLRSGDSADLVFRIDEGVQTRIGEILVSGSQRTQKRDVQKALLLKPGDLFSYRKILESEAFLRKTGSFRNVNIETIGLAERDPVVHLAVRLEEYKTVIVDLGASYDTDRSFIGNVTLNNINLFGTMRRSSIRMIGGPKYQLGELTFKDPNIFGARMDGALSGHIEHQIRPAFESVEGGGAISFLKDFTTRASLLTRYEIIRTFFTRLPDPADPAVRDHTTSKLAASFSYDRRDSFADPHRGYVGFIGADLSTKLFASTFNFVQPKAYFAHYLPLGSRLTLLSFFRGEGIKVLGSDILPRDEKLFLGGDYSIRGFNEDGVGPKDANGNPLGGQVLLAYTAELQALLFSNVKFAAFMDNGSLTNTFKDLNVDSIRSTAGFGLRYVTPVGPIRLDYGIKLDRKPGESFGRVHFAFGYVF